MPSSKGSHQTRDRNQASYAPELAGGFITLVPTGELIILVPQSLGAPCKRRFIHLSF